MRVANRCQSSQSGRDTFPPASADLLEVRDLGIRFVIEGGREAIGLDRINLHISPGEIVGLLGESGCGKTTTALSLLRLLPSNARIISGSLRFRGRDLLSLNEDQLRHVRGADISIIYQDVSGLNPVMRVGDQVSDVLRAHRRLTRQQARNAVEEIFVTVGLSDAARIYDAYPHQLSGGQRRRIGTAQAVVCKPALVIADEPTAWLDAKTTAAILACVKHLNQIWGTAFLFISHDPNILAAVVHRIVVMYAGQVVEEGPVREVYTEPLHPYTRALLQCVPHRSVHEDSAKDRRRLPCIPGYAPDPSERLVGCSFANRCIDRMTACDFHRPGEYLTGTFRSVRCLKYRA
jgi:peptide/nickel transport system ATP-binding protein